LPNYLYFSVALQADFIPYQDSSLHYLYGGKGDKLLFCFHGFGESAENFCFLESHLSDQYTIVAIDLPFHGNSRWNSYTDFEPSSLVALLDKIKDKHAFQQTSYEIVGYSMGGRVALSLVEIASDKIFKVYLLAPDGFKVNFWYWLATQTYLGNKLFSATINNPAPFLWVVNVIHRAGFLNQSIHKYVNAYLHDQKKRKQLYLRWTSLRKFKPNLRQVKAEILKRKIELIQVYGQHDRIILPNRGRRFSDSIHPLGKLEIINSGHRLLEEKHATALVKHILK
jgi:pimeloyl-ACP methyl ester carboxylesterase